MHEPVQDKLMSLSMAVIVCRIHLVTVLTSIQANEYAVVAAQRICKALEESCSLLAAKIPD